MCEHTVQAKPPHLGCFTSASSLCVALPLMVGEGVDGLELDRVLRLVHTELTAAFFSAVL